MAYYKDIRELIDGLERAHLLVRIDRQINKDTQLHPLVRLQFRGLPESERKAFFSRHIRTPIAPRATVRTCFHCRRWNR